MTRFIVYALLGSLVGAGILYVMAVQAGLDPFAANIRTLSFLALAVAVYFGIRVAMVVRGLERRRQGDDTGRERSSVSAFRNWGRDSKLDAKMEARRERVRRAKERREAEKRGE